MMSPWRLAASLLRSQKEISAPAHEQLQRERAEEFEMQEKPERAVELLAAAEAAAAEVCDWATFLDAGPDDTLAAMANRVPEACTGRA